MSLLLALAAFFVAGIFGGVLLGLIGVGMALVTVPLLIFALPAFGFDPANVPLVALATSMAVVSIGSVSSVLSHNRKGNVDWSVAKITIPASLVGITIGSLFASQLPAMVLRIVFAGFLVFVAVRMFRGRRETADAPHATTPWTYRGVGGLIGIAASMIGAGGGVFMVPFLSSRGHPMPRAVATSTTIGLPVSILGAVIYSAQPANLSPTLTWGYLYLPAFFGISAGATLGAPIGARLTSVIPASRLKSGFAIALLVVAAGLLLDL